MYKHGHDANLGGFIRQMQRAQSLKSAPFWDFTQRILAIPC